ncbi:unnamed protein product [Rhizoctonia solani]|uniref:Uncharacterized protein n=1 Tax=Rhizoctonia solani TaxID=456999 RepID=A0A8H3HC78_9AGAM|nr:unnamed protein product [Rhizoctonia solani]
MLAPFGNDGESRFMEKFGARLKSRLMDLSGGLRAETRYRMNDLLWYSTIREDLSGFIEELVKVTILELLQERFLTVPDSYHGSDKPLEQLKYQLLVLWTLLLRSSGTRTTPTPTQFQLKKLKQKQVHPARDTPPRGCSRDLGILNKSTPTQFQLNQQKPADHAACESLLQYIVNKIGALAESIPTKFQLEGEQKPVDHVAHDSPHGPNKLTTLPESTTTHFQPKNDQRPVDRAAPNHDHTAHDSPLRGGINKLGAPCRSDRLADESSINIHQFLTLCKPYLGQIVAWLLDVISLIWGITILAPHVVLTIDQQLEAMVNELEGLGKISCSDLERDIQALCALTENQTGLWFNSPWDGICSFLEAYALDDILKEIFKPKVDFIAKYGQQEKLDSKTVALFQDHIIERIKIHAQEVERNWLGSAVDLQAQLEDVLSLVWKRIREDDSLTEKVVKQLGSFISVFLISNVPIQVSNMKLANQTSTMSGDITTPAQTDQPTGTTPPLSEPPDQSSIKALDGVSTLAQTAALDRPAGTASPSPEPPNQTPVALEGVPTPAHIVAPDRPTRIISASPEHTKQTPVTLEDTATPAKKSKVV